MKKDKKFLLLFIISAVFVFLIPFFTPPQTALAHTTTAYGAYTFEVLNYDVLLDVGADRVVKTEEKITIKYTGYESTGFYRDIPINAGEKVTNIKVSMADGKPVEYYVVMEDYDFVSISIGSTAIKTGKTESYLISYDYNIARPVDANALYLNAIGFGWECKIKDVDVTIKVPNGLKSAKYFVGNTSNGTNYPLSGNTLTLHVDELGYYKGVTFNLYFNKNVLYGFYDFTPLLFLLIGAGFATLTVLFVHAKKDNSVLTPVVNFSAPFDLDPLAMGKIIDNSVNTDDITSMIFYWASKGYVNLNFEDESDPIIIKVAPALPADRPKHEQALYNGLFAFGNAVATSQLANKFYMTIDRATFEVNKTYGGKLYNKKSITTSILFAGLNGLVAGVVALLAVLSSVSWTFFFWPCLLAIIPSLLVYCAAQFFQFNKLKLDEKKLKLCNIGLYALAVALSLVYALLVPSVIDFWVLFLSSLLGTLPVPLCAKLICKTPEYVEQLNHIIGFRNFILYAEKDKLEAMLKDNPQLYYGILPYAQVLGVSDIWEEKFKAITIAPPEWLRGNYSTYDYLYLNHLMRRSRYAMTSNMVSRPSSSGSSGSGGFGGGGGGGHGGGGGRGR